MAANHVCLLPYLGVIAAATLSPFLHSPILSSSICCCWMDLCHPRARCVAVWSASFGVAPLMALSWRSTATLFEVLGRDLVKSVSAHGNADWIEVDAV